VPAGKYGLVTIPEASEWTLILTKQTDVTSPAAYKQENDVVRVKAKPMTLPFSIETFTMSFDDVKSTSMNLSIMWDNVYVALPITSDVDTKVMAQIKTIFEGDTKPYFNAAMYYMDNNKDLNQAVLWLDKALVQNPKAFWVHHQRANALAKLGRKQDAMASANKSMELAKEAKNDDYVKLNEDLLKKLN
jgi:tetratricopeptide (TPR) repeat protein